MEEFDDMFDNKKVFLDPKSHDDLLIDDQVCIIRFLSLQSPILRRGASMYACACFTFQDRVNSALFIPKHFPKPRNFGKN